MSEEDQMMRAIAMSLGQEVSMEQRSDSPEVRHPRYSHYVKKLTHSTAHSYPPLFSNHPLKRTS